MKPEVMCKVSVGEFLDKLSILYVKRQRITDPDRLSFVLAEIQELEKDLENTADVQRWIGSLMEINTKLWDCNEKRKRKIIENDLDQDYIAMTLEESSLADERFVVKNNINKFFNATIREQKSYPWV